MIKKYTKESTENQEQRALVKWIRMRSDISDYVLKMNNEGKRTKAQGWNLTMLGMCRGASDLFLAYPAHGLHGCWIECKRNRKYSPCEQRSETWLYQLQFQDIMRYKGYAAFIAYGWEDGKKKIEQYLAGTLPDEYTTSAASHVAIP